MEGDSGAVTRCLIHPMAIMNISDHFSRSKARGISPVMGCLIGTYADGIWEAQSAFGVPTDPASPADPTSCTIDGKFLNEVDVTKMPMSTRDHYVSDAGVFPEFEVIGWYRSGEQPGAADLQSHQTVGKACEAGNVSAGFLMMLDPTAAEDPERFPLSAFELVAGQFAPLAFRVESNPAESTCISSMAAIKPRSKPAAVLLDSHLGDLKSAIEMLTQNIGTIVAWLQRVQAGEVTPKPALMRSIQALCKRLPAERADKLQGDLLTEYNDVLLAAHLAAMTKCCDSASNLASKFSVFQEQRDLEHGRGLKGMLAMDSLGYGHGR